MATVSELLHAAVAALGGVERPGQVRMAAAVERALDTGEHLLVQAGTGTGKSLGYLVPVVAHGERVVVSTATLALQAQLVGRDLPLLAETAADTLGREPTYAIVKGRANYACLHRLNTGVPDEQGTLVEVAPSSPIGREVVRVREWVDDSETGDRDELVPGVSDRAWSQVSVSARECLGAQKCPYGAECFAELARDQAERCDIVVTNHALLAIDAMHGRTVLPDHDVVVVDEAHELAARVTGAATEELSAAMVERAARWSRQPAGEDAAAALEAAGEALRAALVTTPVGRLDELPGDLGAALVLVRDAARAVLSKIGKAETGEGKRVAGMLGAESGDGAGSGTDATRADAMERQVKALVGQVFDVAERLASNEASDVSWLEDRARGGLVLRVAPLSVAGLLRDRLFADRTVVLTSATLALGGEFDAIARTVGLTDTEVAAVGGRTSSWSTSDASRSGGAASGGAASGGAATGKPTPGGSTSRGSSSDEPIEWTGIDVGSPFDYGRQAILYIARHLPPPGRDGPGDGMLTELLELMTAAGGRTLGLFSSRRGAEAAAAYVRENSELAVLCQGEDGLAELGRQFRAEPAASLFGTLSLWQGIDVPGATCQLVVIDRIPFPRPDDPLSSARVKAVAEAGGNGFMAVAAAHAALLLAQGSGRLVRTAADRGVVAVLDPRLATARYRDYLLRSMPPMWRTTDRSAVLAALRRLDAAAPGVAASGVAAAGSAGARTAATP